MTISVIILLLYLVKPRYLLMSIAIVIIVTIFGARSSGEVLRSSGTRCSATELCVLKWEEFIQMPRVDVDNNILLLVIPRSLRRVLLTIKTITCH